MMTFMDTESGEIVVFTSVLSPYHSAVADNRGTDAQCLFVGFSGASLDGAHLKCSSTETVSLRAIAILIEETGKPGVTGKTAAELNCSVPMWQPGPPSHFLNGRANRGGENGPHRINHGINVDLILNKINCWR